MAPFGVFATLFFLGVWLLPITYVGSAGRDIGWMHRDMRHMQRVACLFTREVGSWGTYHIEIKVGPGGEWAELPLDGYFDMSIFGYRTRFHRLLGKSYRRSGGQARGRYMARWIADRHARLNPGAPALHGVRFVSASRRVAQLLEEKGRFHKLPLDQVAGRYKRVLMTFEGSPLEYVRRPSTRRKARPRTRMKPVPARKAAPTAGGPRPMLQPLPRPGDAEGPEKTRPLRALPVPGRTPPAPRGGER